MVMTHGSPLIVLLNWESPCGVSWLGLVQPPQIKRRSVLSHVHCSFAFFSSATHPSRKGPSWGEWSSMRVGERKLTRRRCSHFVHVGAGVLASALGMDKEFMKVALAAAGLPQLPYVAVRPGRCQIVPCRIGPWRLVLWHHGGNGVAQNACPSDTYTATRESPRCGLRGVPTSTRIGPKLE